MDTRPDGHSPTMAMYLFNAHAAGRPLPGHEQRRRRGHRVPRVHARSVQPAHHQPDGTGALASPAGRAPWARRGATGTRWTTSRARASTRTTRRHAGRGWISARYTDADRARHALPGRSTARSGPAARLPGLRAHRHRRVHVRRLRADRRWPRDPRGRGDLVRDAVGSAPALVAETGSDATGSDIAESASSRTGCGSRRRSRRCSTSATRSSPPTRPTSAGRNRTTCIWNVFRERGMGYFAAAYDGEDAHPVEYFSRRRAAGRPDGLAPGHRDRPRDRPAARGRKVGLGGHAPHPGFARVPRRRRRTPTATTSSTTCPRATTRSWGSSPAGYDRWSSRTSRSRRTRRRPGRHDAARLGAIDGRRGDRATQRRHRRRGGLRRRSRMIDSVAGHGVVGVQPNSADGGNPHAGRRRRAEAAAEDRHHAVRDRPDGTAAATARRHDTRVHDRDVSRRRRHGDVGRRHR